MQSIKEYLPNSALSYRFGKSMLDFDRYKGSITKKIDLLANDLKYDTKYKEYYFSNTNSGDGGLDIVSWLPFEEDENQNYKLIYLCQCAMGKNWINKQNDMDKFVDNYIEFKGSINFTIFIPYDGRNMDRTFNEEANIRANLLIFDRIRLLNLLKDNKVIFSKLNSFENIVNRVIEYEEDII